MRNKHNFHIIKTKLCYVMGIICSKLKPHYLDFERVSTIILATEQNYYILSERTC